MARRTRQISLKECYDILRLQKGADLQAVKTAYRRRAFELHPDLNPGDPEAAHQFQLLNEAYVALSAMLKSSEEAKQKAARGKKQPESGAEAKTGQSGAQATGKTENKTSPGPEAAKAQHAYEEQDVLRDLLNDPFARRVFEDIYSEVGRKNEQRQETAPPPPPKRDAPINEKKPDIPPRPKKEPQQARAVPLNSGVPEKGVKGVVKDWLRKQLDEEQSVSMPAAGLYPGRKIRLQIRPGMSEEVNAVEVTLPPDFTPGKPVRLRGLGKKLGPWQGDLYLTIHAQ